MSASSSSSALPPSAPVPLVAPTPILSPAPKQEAAQPVVQKYHLEEDVVDVLNKLSDRSIEMNAALEQTIRKLASVCEKNDGKSEKSNSADEIIQCYKDGYFYARSIQDPPLDEIKVVAGNKTVLEKKGINNSQQLYQFFFDNRYHNVDQEGGLPGFQWRPMTMIRGGIPIRLCWQKNSVGLILDPNDMGTWGVIFYKLDIDSANLVDEGNYFVLDDKEQGNANKLFGKLFEWNRRRQGLLLDNSARCYGLAYFDHNEVLGTYDLSSIKGILIGDSESTARNALGWRILCNKINNRIVPFFRYYPLKGLLPVSDEEVFDQADMQAAVSCEAGPGFDLPLDFFQRHNILYTQADQEEVYKKLYESKGDNIVQLNDLTCSFPSCSLKEQPITYYFSHQERKLDGRGYVLDGIPIIELKEGENKKRFFDDKRILIDIARQHQTRYVDACNQLLEELKSKVRKIDFIEDDDADSPLIKKCYLLVHYQPPLRAETLLKCIGYPTDPRICKWKLLDDNSIKLYVPQIIETLYHTLRHRCLELKQQHHHPRMFAKKTGEVHRKRKEDQFDPDAEKSPSHSPKRLRHDPT